MTGERNLAKLLSSMLSMSPIVNPGTFVFATAVDPSDGALAEAVAMVREREGVTVVLEQRRADELGLAYDFVAKWITLQVHSSLDAVGLTGAFGGALAQSGISANVIAGYYHDHIFVPIADVDAAVACLQRLARTALVD